MSLQTARERFRQREEAQFESACTITREGPKVTDPDTGAVTSQDETIYEGPCKVKHEQWVGADRPVGATEVRVLPLVLSLPHGTEVAKGDRVLVTDSPDPGLVDAVLSVTDVRVSDWLPVRKVQVELTQLRGEVS